VRLQIARLHRDIGATMIYVTHDQVEAMTLADRIVVLNLGRIEQVGSPRELYERPANTFVATFIGSPRMSLLEADRDGDRLSIGGVGSIVLADTPAERQLTLGVRPDALRLQRGSADDGLAARVIYTEYLGDNAYVHARLNNGTQLSVRTSPQDAYAPDEDISISILPGTAHFFARADGRRLSTGMARHSSTMNEGRTQ
jgi:lactose/L-arabinose transport system ATP-binding protein